MGEFRVVHVIDNLSPGGTEKQCVELVRGLSGRQVENAVFHSRGGPLRAELDALGVEAQAFAVGSFRSLRFPARLFPLVVAVRRWRPAVVQTYGFYSNLPGLLAARLAGVPVRVASRRELARYLQPAQRRLDRLARALAHRVVANSDAVRRHLVVEEGMPSEDVVVIRNGIRLGNGPPLDDVADDKGEAVVGIIAHFREQKDHGTFLKAAAEVVKVIPAVRFCLVGSGTLETEVRAQAAQSGVAARVEFLGHLEGAALHAAVRRMQVSVLTSKDNEGLPNAVLESMAAGRPVIATAVGGTPELVENGVTGFLVPARDPQAVAERLVWLLKEPAAARAMGIRGREKIERDFTLERMVGQFHDLYRDLLRQQKSRGR